MATVFSLSSYSLATIAVTVASGSATPTYIWQAAIPAGAKGKAGILQLFFNLYVVTNFFANQFFDYGIYVDGVPLSIGDSTTIRYTHTASTPYALSSGGVLRGTNGMLGYSPLIIPVSFSTGASVIQIGISNSSLAMSAVTSVSPQVMSNVTTSTGSSNTSNFVPVNTFTTTGPFSYTVPTTVQGGAVQGVYVYLWGAGGSNTSQVGGQGTSSNTICPGGGGGFVSGFYSCAAGTVLTGVVGSIGGGAVTNGGGGYGAGGALSGGFSGLFNGGYSPGNTVAIAGGGGIGNYAASSNMYTGGAGGYPSGDPAYVIAHPTQVGNSDGGSNKSSVYCVGGGQTSTYLINGSNRNAGTSFGVGTPLYGGVGWDCVIGSQFLGAGSYGTCGGGGWYGGATGTTYYNFTPTGGGGGSSYIGNVNGATGGIGLTSGVSYANGTTATATSSTPVNIKPGGIASPFYTGTYGCGNGSTGLVVIVPAVGSSANQVGVQANLFVV